MAALVVSAACGDAGPMVPAVDATVLDLSLYAEPCTEEPDSCATPYECTSVERETTMTVIDICLVPCEAAAACGTVCLCNGVNGGASSVPRNYCACP